MELTDILDDTLDGILRPWPNQNSAPSFLWKVDYSIPQFGTGDFFAPRKARETSRREEVLIDKVAGTELWSTF